MAWRNRISRTATLYMNIVKQFAHSRTQRCYPMKTENIPWILFVNCSWSAHYFGFFLFLFVPGLQIASENGSAVVVPE